jgi:hypothetical protein
MKNRITPLIVILIAMIAFQDICAQDANNYKENKSKFFKLYKEYINKINSGQSAIKPSDPSGLFFIDGNNNFGSTTDNGTIINKDNILPKEPVKEAVNTYTWSQSTTTYTPVAGTTLGSAFNDDEIYGAIPIGFTFHYDGTTYTTVGISTNGYLKFGATPSNTYSGVLGAQANIFAGFNLDFLGNGTTSNLSYATTGSAPNRKFTVQWTSWSLYNGSPDGSNISYQMVLNETSNHIQLIFGPMTLVLTFYTPQCGINTLVSDFSNRFTTTDWSATTAGATNTTQLTLNNTVKPASGLTWTWRPTPLCGPYTIPGSYTTLAAAINDLNSRGVCGTSPVTFFVTPGYTETIPVGGYTIDIPVNPPTSAGPVIFQRNGAGVNPVLNSDAAGSGLITGSLGGNGDAFIKLVGTDYITFNNINITENYTGAVAIPRMEYGFLLVRGSSTDGCKNVTINGCVINMQRVNLVNSGIASLNINAAGTTTNPTTTDGRHENLSVQSCTINNSFNGMYFAGFAASTPWDLYDHSYKIGTVTGNQLTNIGSVGAVNTGTHYGIYSIYHDSMRIVNNTINVNTGLNTATHYGIFTSTGTNSSIDIIGNTVSDSTDNATVAGSSQQAGIYNSFGSSGTDNIVNINNNTVRWCRYFQASSPIIYYIANIGSAYTVNITGNTVDSNTIGGQSFATATSSQYGIYNSATNLNVGAVTNISNNTVRNLTRTQSLPGTGVNYGIYIIGAGLTTNVFNNQVYNNYNGTTTSALAGIYCIPTITGGTLNIYNNTVRDLTKLTGATSGPIYGIYASQSTPLTNVYNNQIYNINNLSATATGVIYGYYNFGSPPVATAYEHVYGNTIRDITHQGTTVSTALFFVGMYLGTGISPGIDKSIHDNQIYNVTTNYGQTGGILVNYADTAYIYNNRIYNITNTTGIGNTPQVYGMFLSNSVTTSVYYVYNNYVSELYADANPTFPGILGIWHNNTSFGGYYYNTIYLDAVSTGANFGTIALYLAGATTQTDLRNNIVINKSTAMGTGGTAALYRGEGVLTYYDALSNNNNFYAGTPTGNNFLYLDPVNTIQTISALKTLMAPRDSASFTENSPFLNTATHPYNLHMSTVIPTYCESGGIPIAAPFAITTDYDGNPRNATTPDVGADEFNGIIPPPPVANVNLTVIPAGFYNTGTGRLNMKDTIKVYLVDSVTCQRVDSAKGVIDSVTYSMSISFSNANTGDYYLMVYHRNHLAVASRFKQNIVRGSTVGYDFSTDSSKAFGFNMVKVSSSPVRWAMISGDANRDGFVDGLDQTIWSGQNGFDGYLSGDFNGDSFVDGLDQTIWIIYNGNGSFLPCGFFLDPVSNMVHLNTPDYDAKRGNMIIFEKKRRTETDSKVNRNNK